MTNFEKIILASMGVLIAIILVIGVFVFNQQKKIAAFSKKMGISSAQLSSPKNNLSLDEVIKRFSGSIESISGNQMVINVKLADLSKPKDSSKLKNAGEPVNFSADDFAVLEKKITVNTNEKTVFLGKKTLAELKVGDAVSVDSDKSPYASDTVTAVKITYTKLSK